MGLLAIDYALHGPINPSLLVVTDTNKPKLSYARRHYPSEPQTLIHYLDGHEASRDTLLALSGGHGFDDIFVFVPNEQLITPGLLVAGSGRLPEFLCWPRDKQFSAPITSTTCTTPLPTTSAPPAVILTICAAVALMQAKKVQTAKVVTHILGLNAAGETTLDLPAVGGGKSWCIPEKPSRSRRWARSPIPNWQRLWRVTMGSGREAEAYLLAHAEDITHD